MAGPATTQHQALQAVRAWVKLLGDSGGLTDAQVRVAEDSGPRPDLPYLTVRITADVAVGEPTEHRALSGSDPIVYYVQHRRLTVSVQGYGPTSSVWLERACALRASPASQALLVAQGVTLRPSGGLVNITELLDNAFEARFSQDLTVDYLKSTQDDAETQTELSLVEVDATVQKLSIDESDPDAIVTDIDITT